MLQMITVIGPNLKKYDIQVDNKQRIQTTLRVLRENMDELAEISNEARVRVKSSGRILNVKNTYAEEKIYTGAELIIAESDKKSVTSELQRG